MQPVIIDFIVICVLAGFILCGAYRGLFRSLVGLVAAVIALVGAGLFARTLVQPVTDLVSPLLEARMEQRVHEALTQQGIMMPQGSADSPEYSRWLRDLLDQLEIDPAAMDSFAQRVTEQLRETGTTVVTAVAENLLYSVIYGILFLLAFLVIMVALYLLTHTFDLLLKLPVLHGLNALGGAAFGLVEGGLLIFLAIWAMRHLGVSFETELVSATHILRFFTTNTPLGVVSFLL